MTLKPQTLNGKIISGAFLWAYLATYSGKILTFLSTVILARLLFKEDFGIAGYALILINFLNLPGLGIGPALIYYDEEKNRTATAFWLSLVMGLALFGLMWGIAPLAGYLFNDDRAIPVTRALALTFPIRSLAAINSAVLQKELAFKRKFIPSFVQSLTKGLASIILAWSGFGAWSLILGQLAGEVATTVTLWMVYPWRPSLYFNPALARSILSYTINIASVYVFGSLLLNVDYLFVGRFLGAAALGVYTLAFRIPELLIKQFCSILSQVLFPAYSKMRDDPAALRRGFLTTMRHVTTITVPMGLGLALISKPFVLVVFTEKWAEAIPVMTAISIYTLLYSLAFNVGDIYKAQGRPNLLAKQSFLHVVVLVPTLWGVTTYYGSLTAIAWAQVVVASFIITLRLVVAGRILDIPFKVIMANLRPVMFGGALMTAAVLSVLNLTAPLSPLIQLVMSVSIGALTYGGALWWLQRDVVIQAGHTLHTVLIRR